MRINYFNTFQQIEREFRLLTLVEQSDELAELEKQAQWHLEQDRLYSVVTAATKQLQELAAKLREAHRQTLVSIRIKELQQQKIELLDKHGIFGGGQLVNEQFNKINRELESLGIKE